MAPPPGGRDGGQAVDLARRVAVESRAAAPPGGRDVPAAGSAPPTGPREPLAACYWVERAAGRAGAPAGSPAILAAKQLAETVQVPTAERFPQVRRADGSAQLGVLYAATLARSAVLPQLDAGASAGLVRAVRQWVAAPDAVALRLLVARQNPGASRQWAAAPGDVASRQWAAAPGAVASRLLVARQQVVPAAWPQDVPAIAAAPFWLAAFCGDRAWRCDAEVVLAPASGQGALWLCPRPYGRRRRRLSMRRHWQEARRGRTRPCQPAEGAVILASSPSSSL